MELRDYLRILRARKWIIVEAVVIFTIIAVGLSLLQTPKYQGQSTVLVTNQDTGAAIFGTALASLAGQPENSLATQVQLMQLRPLAESTVRKLGLQMSPEALLARVKVAAIGQTNVVSITAVDADPKRATDIANAMAEAYTEMSRDSKRASIKAAADEVQLRLDDAKTQILALGKKITDNQKTDKNGNVIPDQSVQAELTIATNLYATLAEKLETLRVNEQLEVGSGQIVSVAVVNRAPVSPQPVRNGLLGVFAGLVFGVALAFLLEYLDNTIKSNEEAEKLYGAPVLGHIPLEQFENGEKRRLTITQHPGSPAAESYRALRNSLDFINFQHNMKTLLVASSVPGEGKSTVASNLAAGLAQAGKKVVLVAADFRRPTTDQFFPVNNHIGLSEVLTGQTPLKTALQRPGDDQLLVLTAGKMPPNPSELLGSENMHEVLESMKEWADWIIIDSPPLLAVADAAAVARWCDGVLMVTRGGSSARDAATKGRAMLEQVGARIIGVAVWGLESSSGRQGYYGDYYSGKYYGKYTSNNVAAKSGAVGPGVAADDSEMSIPDKGAGRKVAEFIGGVMAGLLVFVIVLGLIAVVVYFMDSAFGWGLVQSLGRMVGVG